MKRRERMFVLTEEKGVWEECSDEYDITIHCRSQGEKDRVMRIINLGVKAARWRPIRGYENEVVAWECSGCGEAYCMEEGTPEENKYFHCPNCGAVMDGEGKSIRKR